MFSRKIARVILASAVLGVGSILGVAHATSISGMFTLVQDEGETPGFNVATGDVVAVVNFDAEETGISVGGSDLFNVTRLELTDRTALLDNNGNGSFGDDPSLIGNFLYESVAMSGTTTSPSNGLSALFDSSSGAFAGLSGSILDTSPFRLVSFGAAGVSLSGGSATVIGQSGYGDSFSLVPEPGILVLFGAGLIAVGFGRRRFKTKLVPGG